MKVTNFSKWTLEIFCVLTIIILGITTLALIHHYGVDIPYWDQWGLVSKLEKWVNKTLTINDLHEQHNYHRMVFPQLIMLTMASLSNWNIKLEMYVSYVLATFSLVTILIMLSALKLNAKEFALIAVLITGFIYSPIQAINWLWGWQIQWFLAVLTMLLSIYFIYQASSRKNAYLSVIGAAICAFISSYSLASGLLIWIIVLSAFVLYKNLRRNISLWLIWLIGGVTTYATYLWEYTRPTNATSIVEVLKQPISIMKYIGLYLSNPLIAKEIIGWTIILLFCLCCLFLFMNSAVYRKLWPWFAIGLFAMGNAFITALGRAGLGTQQATAGRYITVSLLFLIATIVLSQQIIKVIFKRSWQKQLLFTVSFLVLFALGLLGWYKGILDMKEIHIQRLVTQECISHYQQASNSCLKKSLPNARSLRQRIEKAYALDFIRLKENGRGSVASNWPIVREQLIVSSDKDPPFVEIRDDQRLFAHAPAKLQIPFSGAYLNKLEVNFGLYNSAWRKGNTDGVLFTISLLNSREEKVEIWSRLLQPKKIAADRGEQIANIDLPKKKGILIFETKSHGNSAWDWSYWSMVQLK